MAELQAKQMKLAEKAGRMKQNIGVVSRCLELVIVEAALPELTSGAAFQDCQHSCIRSVLLSLRL